MSDLLRIARETAIGDWIGGASLAGIFWILLFAGGILG